MDHASGTKSVVGDLILPVTCSLHAISIERGDKAFATAIQHGFNSELVRKSLVNSRFETLHRLATGRETTVSTLQLLKRTKENERYVFKEPFVSFSPSLVTSDLASGVFWLIRDGRDVANSLVKSYNVLTDESLKQCKSNENPVKSERKVRDLYIPWWVQDEEVDAFVRSSPYIRAGLMWAFMNKNCSAEFKKNSLVHEARYEDLVSDHEYCIETICKFLSVNKTRELERACRKASPRSIGAFERRERSEVVELEKLIGETLAIHGYS